jgi:hypothetical protein
MRIKMEHDILTNSEEDLEWIKIGFGSYMIDFSDILDEDYFLLYEEVKRINKLRGR